MATGKKEKRGVELGKGVNPEAQAIFIVHACCQKNIACRQTANRDSQSPLALTLSPALPDAHLGSLLHLL